MQMQDVMSKPMPDFREGSIVKGRILEIRPREVLVDIGYKSEGVIPSREFDDIESSKSATKWMCSSSGSKTTKAWSFSPRRKPPIARTGTRSRAFLQGDGLIKGKVKSVVKGGLMVNIGVEAFLPASQIDIVPPKDLQQFVGNTYDFKIVKINDDRKNVVLSRRELIEQERSEKRQKFLEGVKVGDTCQGHRQEPDRFRRVHRSRRHGRLAPHHRHDLGPPRSSERTAQSRPATRSRRARHQQGERARLVRPEADPEESVGPDRRAFPAGQQVKGKITNLVPYGAFVELEEGVEGLIHVSELSWTKRIMRPSDVLTVGQEVEAVVLGVNKEEQKISLGLRQLEAESVG